MLNLKKLLTKILTSMRGMEGSYTPSITATASGLSVTNIAGFYATRGKILLVSVRFQITAKPTANSNLKISLPNGYTSKMSMLGGCGSCTLNANTQLQLSPRVDYGNDYMTIQQGSGGYTFPNVPADWVVVNAQIPI